MFIIGKEVIVIFIELQNVKKGKENKPKKKRNVMEKRSKKKKKGNDKNKKVKKGKNPLNDISDPIVIDDEDDGKAVEEIEIVPNPKQEMNPDDGDDQMFENEEDGDWGDVVLESMDAVQMANRKRKIEDRDLAVSRHTEELNIVETLKSLKNINHSVETIKGGEEFKKMASKAADGFKESIARSMVKLYNLDPIFLIPLILENPLLLSIGKSKWDKVKDKDMLTWDLFMIVSGEKLNEGKKKN